MGIKNIDNTDTGYDTWKNELVDKYNKCMCCCSPECCSRESCIQRWAVCGYCFIISIYIVLIIFSPVLGILILAGFLILIVIIIGTGCCFCFCCFACCCRVHEIGRWLLNNRNIEIYTRWLAKYASCCPCCCCCCLDAEKLVDLRIKTGLETEPTKENKPPKQVQAPENIVIKKTDNHVEIKDESPLPNNDISLDDIIR